MDVPRRNESRFAFRTRVHANETCYPTRLDRRGRTSPRQCGIQDFLGANALVFPIAGNPNVPAEAWNADEVQQPT
jgi:hypothetical protein